MKIMSYRRRTLAQKQYENDKNPLKKQKKILDFLDILLETKVRY